MVKAGIGVCAALALSITTSTVAVSTGTQTNSTWNVNYGFDFVSVDRLRESLERHSIIKSDINLTNVTPEVKADSINNVTSEYNVYEVYAVTNEKQENIVLLDSFNKLEDNWDGYNAAAPTKELIEFVKLFVVQACFQPEIFPTPDGGIQLEYTMQGNRHLNIEVFNDGTACVFEMYADKTYSEETVEFEFSYINQRVNKFYDAV